MPFPNVCCRAFALGRSIASVSSLSRCLSSAVHSQLGETGGGEQVQRTTTRVSLDIVTTLQTSRLALARSRCPNASPGRPLHPFISIRVAPSAWRPKLGLISQCGSSPKRRSATDLRTSPLSSIFSYARVGSPVKDGKLMQENSNEVGIGSRELMQSYSGKTNYRKNGRPGSLGRPVKGIALVNAICALLKGDDRWERIRETGLKLDTYHVGEILKRQDDPRLALSFFHWAATQTDFHHNMFTFHIMLRVLTRSREFDCALRFVDEMYGTDFKPDVVTFTILISGFGAANRLDSALEVLKIMREVGCKPNIFTYNILINIHSRFGLYEDGRKLFEQMRQEGVEPNAPTYSSIINCIGKAGDLNAANNLFAEMKERRCAPDVVTYTTIIDLHSKAGLYQRAIDCYKEMLAAKLKPDIVILCAVMDCLGKAGDVLGANRVFEDLKDRGYVPDAVAYTNIIDIHVKSGFYDRAVQLFNEMREMNVQANVANYNSMLDCLGKAGNVKAASMLFEEMKLCGFVPDLKTYSIMMCMHARLGLKHICLQLFEELQKAGLQPNTTILVAVIDCLGKAGSFSAAWSLFSEIKEHGYALNVVCYTRLIDICAKCGQYKQAFEVYTELEHKGLEPNVFTYNALIHCLGKSGDTTTASNIFCEMKRRGCKPNIVTYNTLMDLYSKAGKPELSLEVFTSLEADGVQPDAVTFVTMMEALSRAGHPGEAEHMFQKMVEAGPDAKRPAYNILIDAWGKTGNMAKVDYWYKELIASGIAPNQVTAKSVVVAYLRAHEYDSVGRFIESLSAEWCTGECGLAAIILQHCAALDLQEDEHVNSGLSLIVKLEQKSTYSFVQSLLSKTSSEDVQPQCKRFFDSLREDEESKVMFLDALIWFLHSQKRYVEAGHVWDYAMANGFYSRADIVRKTSSEWAIDLHSMSVGTAVIALTRMLSDFKAGIVRERNVPTQVAIITGWGRGSRVPGYSTVKQTVQKTLHALGSPFGVDRANGGCFVCSGASFAEWVKQT